MTDQAPVSNRPTSVTAISWFLIAMGTISLLGALFVMNNPQAAVQMARTPIPIPIQYAMSFGGTLVMVVSGAAMLLGQNWGRFLYVIWSGCGFLVGLITSPTKLLLIPGGLIYLIFVMILFRRTANEFFSPSKVSTPGEVA